MASGLKKAGVDLDTLLMARVNAKRADVGLRVAGVDISNRYETIGGASPIAATGFKSAGVDLASLFRNISAPLGVPYALHAVYWDSGFGSAGIGFHSYWGAGSIAPSSLNGVPFINLTDITFGTDAGKMSMAISGDGAPSAFASITLNGVTFNSSAAAYYNSPGIVTSWTWSMLAGLVNGGDYTALIS
jgi:hypothetical protein